MKNSQKKKWNWTYYKITFVIAKEVNTYWSYIVQISICINLASNILLLASKKYFLTIQGKVRQVVGIMVWIIEPCLINNFKNNCLLVVWLISVISLLTINKAEWHWVCCPLLSNQTYVLLVLMSWSWVMYGFFKDLS